MMNEVDRSMFWWANVPGPHRAVLEAAEALSANRSVLLKAPPDVSWPDVMRGVLEEQFKSRTGAYEISVTRIYAGDCPQEMDPGRFLLSRFASPADQRRYRPSSRLSVQDFLRQNGILENRLIWVYGLDEKSADEWLQFVRGYSGRRPQEGIFILEGPPDIPEPEGQRTQTVDLASCITRDDVQLFCRFALGSGSPEDGPWNDYISALAARVCGTDAWLASAAAEDPAIRVTGILPVLEMLSATEDGALRAGTPGHVLAYVRMGRTEELEHRIWSAQIEILFPLIELRRMTLVRRWEPAIQEGLDEDPVERFGSLVTEARDAELGALVFMLGRRMPDGRYNLYLPDPQARDEICFLAQCRNRLAHADICSPEETARILDEAGRN